MRSSFFDQFTEDEQQIIHRAINEFLETGVPPTNVPPELDLKIKEAMNRSLQTWIAWQTDKPHG